MRKYKRFIVIYILC